MNNINKYISLHNHTEFSVLDGACKVDDIIIKSKKMRFDYCSMTDHGNIDGAIRFFNACKKNDIKPIIGCELYIVENRFVQEKGDKRLHCVYICKNSEGFKSLMKMLTEANITGFYYRPRIDKSLLEDNFDGNNAILLTGCSSGILNEMWGRKLIKRLNRLYPESVYVELMPFNDESCIKYFEYAYEFSKKYNIDCVITNDVHYLRKDDWRFHECLLGISSRKKKKDKDRWRFDKSFRGELCLKSYKGMCETSLDNMHYLSSKQIKKYLSNSYKIAELCKDFDLPTIQVELPEVVEGVKSKKQSDRYLSSLCRQEIKKRGFGDNDKYNDRLEYELERITRLGFSEMMLLVSDYVNWAKENGIMVGHGRGSVGGSLVAYLLRITEVDPVRYDLLFDRFITEGRIDLPDIDMDFEDRKRYLVEEYLENKYGKDNCAHVSTTLKYRGRQSLRDAGRYMDVSYSETDRVAKSILKRSVGDMRSSFSCQDTFDVIEEARDYKRKYPEAAEYAQKLEGRIKTVGVHAAGYVICKDKLNDGSRCVLVKRKGKIAVNWDKKDIEHQGLLKLDILGLNTLSVLEDTRKLIKKRKNIDINYYEIDPEGEGCKKVYEEFNKGNTVGVFQFTTDRVREETSKMGVSSFKDIYDLNALCRPGSLRSGLINNYRARRHGEEKVEKVCKIYDKITKNTYGIILYQEQMMDLLYNLAGMPWKTVDTIRKVVSKSEGVEKFLQWKNEFIEGCKKKKTLDEETAAELYEKLKDFGSYSFNKAHSLAYSILSYITMYMKVFYPIEYMCSLINLCGNEDKRTSFIKEAIRMGIKVRLPDARYSTVDWEIASDDTVVAPLTCIKQIGEKSVDNFINFRDKNEIESIDKHSLIKKMILSNIGKSVIVNMIKVGAMDWLDFNLKHIADNFDEIKKSLIKENKNEKK